MTKTKLKKLKLLFAQEDKYQKLSDIGEHAKVGQELLLKTSRQNQILILDGELAKLISEYAKSQLKEVQAQLEEAA